MNLGLMGELEFQIQALIRGLKVSIPVDPASSYDVIVDNGTRLLRVQVKTRKKPKTRGFCLSLQCGGHERNKRRIYSKNDIDVLVIIVDNSKTIYVIPVERFKGWCIWVNPGGRGEWEEFRDAWQYLTSPQVDDSP